MKITKYQKEAILRAIMNDVPKPDKVKRKAELQETIVKMMSPECRKVYKLTPNALSTYHGGSLLSDVSYSTRAVIRGDLSDAQVEKLLQKYRDEDNKIEQARQQLKGAIESCTTLKQLNDVMPEFKRYFPTEEKQVANLPALTNVVSDLEKLGWPKKSGAKA